MKKILILRFSSIGDIVLTTPVIRCLKTQGENFEIHYCTKKSYQGLLSENPYVDKVYVLKDSLGELVKELKKEKFDYVIDLHTSLRSFLIKKRLGVKSYAFDKLNFKKYLLPCMVHLLKTEKYRITSKILKLNTQHVQQKHLH